MTEDTTCPYCSDDDQPDVETMDQLVDHLTDVHDAFSVAAGVDGGSTRIETDGGVDVDEEAPEVGHNERDINVITEGGEIHFNDDRDAHVPDRIEILNGGWVKAIYKKNYQQELHPPDVIEGIYTHTNDLEDERWW